MKTTDIPQPEGMSDEDFLGWQIQAARTWVETFSAKYEAAKDHPNRDVRVRAYLDLVEAAAELGQLEKKLANHTTQTGETGLVI